MLEFLNSVRSDFLDYFFMPAALPLEELAVPLIAWFVWVGNRKFGWRSMLTILSGMLLATGLKNLFRIQRPWIIISDLKPMHIEGATGYSFPSGHSSFAVLFCFGFLYPLIVGRFKRKWISVVICTIPTLYLMISRLYYNVHTLGDVFAGAVIGFVWLWICNILFKISEKKKSRLPLVSLGFPTIFAFFILLVPFINSLPPYADDTLKLVGMSLILTPFSIWESIKTPGEDKIRPIAKLSFFLVGLISILLIKNGTGLLYKTNAINDNYLILVEVLRYALIGIFVIWFYPVILRFVSKKIVN